MNTVGSLPPERWLAEQACRDCILRAGAALDAGDYVAFSHHFARDGTLMRPNQTVLEGRDAILASYLQRPASRSTRHLLTNIIVDLESPTLARARSTVLLWSATRGPAERDSAISVDEGGPAKTALNGRCADPLQLLGEFDDMLARYEEGWLIAKRVARFVMFRNA
jgi:SnoaL-like domain